MEHEGKNKSPYSGFWQCCVILLIVPLIIFALIYFAFDRASICFVPFINIPFFDIAPIQVKNAKGTDITILHGHDATKNTKALIIHVLNS